MAMFGLFDGAKAVPIQKFEGDRMSRDGEFVTIWNNARSDEQTDRQVAAIRLDRGQSVKEFA